MPVFRIFKSISPSVTEKSPSPSSRKISQPSLDVKSPDLTMLPSTGGSSCLSSVSSLLSVELSVSTLLSVSVLLSVPDLLSADSVPESVPSPLSVELSADLSLLFSLVLLSVPLSVVVLSPLPDFDDMSSASVSLSVISESVSADTDTVVKTVGVATVVMPRRADISIETILFFISYLQTILLRCPV